MKRPSLNATKNVKSLDSIRPGIYGRQMFVPVLLVVAAVGLAFCARLLLLANRELRAVERERAAWRKRKCHQ